MRGLKALRDDKGIVFVKSAGNEFDSVGLSEDTSADCGVLAGAYGCVNSGNDTTNLEPNVIVTAALNAKGQAASYSSTGSVLWITGMGGEYASAGQYGEQSRLSAEQIAQGRAGDGLRHLFHRHPLVHRGLQPQRRQSRENQRFHARRW